MVCVVVAWAAAIGSSTAPADPRIARRTSSLRIFPSFAEWPGLLPRSGQRGKTPDRAQAEPVAMRPPLTTYHRILGSTRSRPDCLISYGPGCQGAAACGVSLTGPCACAPGLAAMVGLPGFRPHQDQACRGRRGRWSGSGKGRLAGVGVAADEQDAVLGVWPGGASSGPVSITPSRRGGQLW